MSAPVVSSAVWRRFRRNTVAVAGFFLLVFAVFVALFAYLLAPDGTPDANNQLPELALLPPGSRIPVLHVRSNTNAPETGFFKKMLFGAELSYKIIPLAESNVFTEGDSLCYRRYGSYIWEKMPVVDLANPPLRRANSDKHQRRPQAAPLQTSDFELRTFPLGTDRYGRCMLSRLLLGFRVSLGVGALAVVVSLSLGLFLGLVSAYFGGHVDDLVMLLINTVWSIPTLLLVFAVVMALGRGVGIIFLAVGLTMWVEVARVVRGQVMQLRSMPFVEAAQSMGLGSWRVVFRHILPNLLGPVLVLTAGNFATAILLESGLSYLGFGVQPPAPSWGSLLNENYGYALSGRPVLAVAPALVIALSVLAFNLVGNGLRDALDVKMKG